MQKNEQSSNHQNYHSDYGNRLIVEIKANQYKNTTLLGIMQKLFLQTSPVPRR